MSTAGTPPLAPPAGPWPGSKRKPLTSFTRSAPASRAARATAALVVSTESGPAPAVAQRLDHGHDAPASPRRRPRGRAPGPRGLAAHVHDVGARLEQRRGRGPPRPSASRKRPPSENESGVTLSTPMTQVRSPRTALLAAQGEAVGRRRGAAALPSLAAPRSSPASRRSAAARTARRFGGARPAPPTTSASARPWAAAGSRRPARPRPTLPSRAGGGGRRRGSRDADLHRPALDDLP